MKPGMPPSATPSTRSIFHMRSLACLLYLAAALQLAAQAFNPHFEAAKEALSNKDYPGALAAYQSGLKTQPDNTVALYHAARCAAQLQQDDLAFDLLDRAFPAGEEWLVSENNLATNPELAPLRASDQWRNFIATVEQRRTETATGPYAAVKAELLSILEADQAGRKQLDEIEKTHGHDSPEMQRLWADIAAKDSANRQMIEAILQQHGWLGPKQVGPKANSAFFLVIQHADFDTQRRYLPVMREAVQAGRAHPSMLAMLEDRVALREGRPQVYGSQIGFVEETETHYVLPLADPDGVDARRSSVGLPPLADYVKQWNIQWDPEAYKKVLPHLKNTFVR